MLTGCLLRKPITKVLNSDGIALQAAYRYGEIDVVRVLLESKGNPNIGIGPSTNGGDNGATPLINAAYYMPPEEIKQLLAAGAVINRTDSKGDTALIIAAGRGDAETLKLLCNDGATMLHDSPKNGFALSISAKKGNIECVRVLAERLSPLFGGINKAIARGSTFVRDLVANPENEQEIVDMNGFHLLRQDNIKLEQQLEYLHSLQAR
ncbi:hypothetical protein FSARC_8007 [Fusarium sarcochroum]|uniref:Ankyrin n=1 Tax=Fusarium sarcochroum TaxID=1208366 RepID=A0A8H4TU79_9HYPO|nr:hypothetical protein FSARC_8007 [Fusarium sarcochroum]